MAKKKVGQVITRPGRTVNHPDVTIRIPEDLMTVPGAPHLPERGGFLQSGVSDRKSEYRI